MSTGERSRRRARYDPVMATTVQGGYFGQELKGWRERARISRIQMAERLGVQPPTVSRWEVDSRGIHDPHLTMYLTECGASAADIELFKVRNSTVLDAVWSTLGATTDRASVVGALRRAEYRAKEITIVASSSIPALFQTSGYASFTMERAGVPEDEIATRVAERLGRAAMVRERAEPLMFDMLIDEAVLLRPLRSVAATLAQIKYLHEYATRSNVNVQVVPLAQGWSEMQYGQFNIYDFPDDPSVAYEELHNVMIFFNDPADVEGTYRTVVERVRPLAMSPEESIGLMLKEIEKLENIA